MQVLQFANCLHNLCANTFGILQVPQSAIQTKIKNAPKIFGLNIYHKILGLNKHAIQEVIQEKLNNR